MFFFNFSSLGLLVETTMVYFYIENLNLSDTYPLTSYTCFSNPTSTSCSVPSRPVIHLVTISVCPVGVQYRRRSYNRTMAVIPAKSHSKKMKVISWIHEFLMPVITTGCWKLFYNCLFEEFLFAINLNIQLYFSISC